MSRAARRVAALTLGAGMAHLARTVASAQVAGAATTEVGAGVSTFGLGDWAGLGLRLAVVLVVIWGSVVAMRWYVRRTQGAGGRRSSAALEVLETHPLGPNRALHLVRLGDRAVLVGATPERITSLLTVDDAEEVRRLAERPETPGRRSLAASLSALASSSPAVPSARAAGTPTPLAAMAAGLGAFRTMLPALPGRLRRDAALDTDLDREIAAAGRPAAGEKAPGRLAAARALLGRPRGVEAGATVASVEPQPRLFARTLAAAEQTASIGSGAQELDASRTLRARSGYAATGQVPLPSRAQRIAELRQAITEAQRNAG